MIMNNISYKNVTYPGAAKPGGQRGAPQISDLTNKFLPKTNFQKIYKVRAP